MAKDLFHYIVKTALEKEGWTVTDDPYTIRTPLLNRSLEIDLAAEKLIAAEKGVEKIAVEVKSFIGESLIYDFHAALGQMLNYQINMDIQEPDRLLILAIPDNTFAKMMQQPFYEVAMSRYNIHFLVFDKINQQIIQWNK